MTKIVLVSVALLVAGCAASHAPRVSCSARLEDINPPQSMGVSQPKATTPEATVP